MNLSEYQSLYIMDSIKSNCRLDGRTRNTYRSFSIEKHKNVYTCGSSTISLGNTVIECGITSSIEQYPNVSKGKGRIDIEVFLSSDVDAVDLSEVSPALKNPTSFSTVTQLFIQSKLAQLVQPNIDESGIDLSELYISDGVYIVLKANIVIKSYDGSLLVASSLALKAALCNTTIPAATILNTSGTLAVSVLTNNPGKPFASARLLSIWIVLHIYNNGYFIIDASKDEELLDSATLSLSISSNDFINHIEFNISNNFKYNQTISINTSDIASIAKEGLLFGKELYQSFIEKLNSTS